MQMLTVKWQCFVVIICNDNCGDDDRNAFFPEHDVTTLPMTGICDWLHNNAINTENKEKNIIEQISFPCRSVLNVIDFASFVVLPKFNICLTRCLKISCTIQNKYTVFIFEWVSDRYLTPREPFSRLSQTCI